VIIIVAIVAVMPKNIESSAKCVFVMLSHLLNY